MRRCWRREEVQESQGPRVPRSRGPRVHLVLIYFTTHSFPGSQFKGRTNLINLANHQLDYNIKAEWIFGKNIFLRSKLQRNEILYINQMN